MIHRRALINGLLASVAVPVVARLALALDDDIFYQLVDFAHNTGRTPYGWLTYWDGEYICRREVSWDELYQRD